VRCDETEKFISLDAIDQAGIRVVENRGGTNQQFALSKIDRATIIIVPNNAKPFDYLKSGKADVMFTDSIEAIYRQKQNKGLCAVSPDKPYTRVEKVFMFRTDEAGLRDSFNRWLAARAAPAANAAQ
jgi:cyclohexadienyl dehydratase